MEREGRTSPTDELERGERPPPVGEPRSPEDKPQAKRDHTSAQNPQKKEKEEPPTDDTAGVGRSEDEKSPFAAHCQSDAKIWQLYLKEAEIEDKEITGIWNDSLDSLLVFAGLFAGVLTAFLIESLKELKQDPQEALLQKIADLLSNASDSSSNQPFQPDASSKHVNILWIISLTLTLLSALGAVLAKGWTAKYNPASYREQLSDACERMLRANRAQEWRLEAVITGIPLLIQASLFLFFSGLLIQIIDNDIEIWLTAVILIGFAGLFYIIGTILPWFSPACPFQTPISSFLPGGTAQGRYRDPSTGSGRRYAPLESWSAMFFSSPQLVYDFWKAVRQKPTQQVLRGQILSWLITNSTKQETIEEAMRAVAGSEASADLQVSLVESGADAVLCRKLRECVKLTPGLPKTAEDFPRLEYLLYAHLHLEERSPTDEGAPGMTDDFLLRDGQALHRWDDFPPHLQALAFSLRVHMLINRGRDEHEENWAQTLNSVRRLAQAGSPPNVRNVLLCATIRGLARGRNILRKTCAYIFSGQILIPDVRERLQDLTRSTKGLVSKEGEKTMSNVRQEVAEFLAQACICYDRDDIELGITTLAKVIRYGVFPLLAEDTAERIIRGLGSENLQVRESTVFALERLADYAEAHNAIKPFTLQFIKLLEDESGAVRRGTLSVIGNLANHALFHDDIKASVLQLINSLSHSAWDVRAGAASTIKSLADHAVFHDYIKPTIPRLADLLKDPNGDVRKAAMSAIEKLAKHAKFGEAISLAVPGLIKQFEDGDNSAVEAAVFAIEKLANHLESPDTIKSTTLRLINLIRDQDSGVSATATSAIAQLANNATCYDDIRPSISQIIRSIEDTTRANRVAAVSTIKRFAKDEAFHDDIKSVTSQLIKLLGDPSNEVRKVAISAIAQLAGHATFYEAVKTAIPQIIRFLGDSSWVNREAAASAVGQLANNAAFHDDVKFAILQLINLLKDLDYDVRKAAASAIGRVADYGDFEDSIKPATLPLINLLHDRYKDVRSAASSAIEHVVNHVDGLPSIGILSSIFTPQGLILNDKYVTEHGLARPIIPQLLLSFRSESSQENYDGVLSISHVAEISRALPWLIVNTVWTIIKATSRDELLQLLNITSHAGIKAALSTSVLRLAESTTKWDEPMRHSVPLVVLRLVEDADLRDTIKPVIPQLIKLMEDPLWTARTAAASAVGQLANYVEFYDDIKPAVSQLINLVKDPDSDVHRAAALALGQISVHSTADDNTDSVISPLIGLLQDVNGDLREAAASAIGRLGSQVELREDIKPATAQLINLLSDSEENVRHAAIPAIVQLAGHAEFNEHIKSALLQISNLSEDSIWSSREAAASAVGQLAKHVELHDDIKSATVQLMKLLEDPDDDVRRAAVSAIRQLANHATFHGDIKSAVPQLINLLRDSYGDVRIATATTIAQLADHVEFHEIINFSILQLINQLMDPDSDLRKAAAYTVVHLAKHVVLQDTIKPAVPQIIRLLEDPDPSVCSSAASAISMMMQEALPFFSLPLVGNVVLLLRHNVREVRANAASLIEEMLKYNHTHENILESSLRSNLIELLQDRELAVLRPLARTLVVLVEHGYMSDGVVNAVLNALELLDDPNLYVRQCGATIISAMTSSVRLRNILVEIGTIKASLQLFANASSQEASTIIQRMEHFGVLKEL